MVNSFAKLQADVLNKCKYAAAECGVNDNNVKFSGSSIVPPGIQVAVYPVDESPAQKHPIWFDAAVDVFCFVPGAQSNQDALNKAMEIAWSVIKFVNVLPNLTSCKNPSVVNFLNQNGQITHSDKTCVVISWNAKYQVGI